ncbi:hypothetical protein GAB14E_3184 [Colwellia psychrerythraea]|uniref:Uncharacterized protein n=2 Tax=Colwellia psychrerythraea TaxID=28229 RepID=A0A099KP74_COLPS|nr:hypothetical protein GAB14E_3184 [Colwellia psychrerythraea]
MVKLISNNPFSIKNLIMKKLKLVITTLAVSFICTTSAHTDPHTHSNHSQLIELPSIKKVPSIDIYSEKDAVNGYNIKLEVKNYLLESPNNTDNVHSTNIVNGHAHLYINDTKVMRIYGNSFHVPENALLLNTNKLEVTLNNHHHQTWSANGKPIKDIIFIKK